MLIFSMIVLMAGWDGHEMHPQADLEPELSWRAVQHKLAEQPWYVWFRTAISLAAHRAGVAVNSCL